MSLPTPPLAVRRAWPWLRLVGGAVVLLVLLWRFGTGPFAEAWHVTTWPAVLAALVVTLAATLTSAWRGGRSGSTGRRGRSEVHPPRSFSPILTLRGPGPELIPPP